MPNVLITGGGRWVGLVLRLKQAMTNSPLRGGRLFVADQDALNAAGFFGDGTLVAPAMNHPDYIDRLLELCVRHDVRVVVPHLDIDLDRLAPQQRRFADADIRLVCPRADLVELCRDKNRFRQFAEEEGLPQPRTYGPEELRDDLFPLFAKQVRGSASAGAGVCRSAEEARAALQCHSDLIFQELVERPEISVDAYVSARGRCTVRVPRLRERVIGGEAVQSRTLRCATLAELADRTIAALARRGYRGPLNVQLFSGEQPLLIEVNARLGSASVLADHATDGRLFSSLLCEACGGIADDDPDDYKDDSRLFRYWGEVYHDGQGPPQFSPPRIENCTMNTDKLHPIPQAAFAALEQAGVRYCLLRWPANPAAPQGDVDLLVEGADIGRMRAALRDLGLVRFPSIGSGNEHVFLAYHAATDCWIRLHVVTELSFGPRHRLRTGAATACLARCRHGGGGVQLAAEDEFWTTLLHCLTEKGSITARHRDRLRKLASEAEPEGPLREVVQRVCPADWGAARMVDGVRRDDWDELQTLAPALAAAWRRRTSLSCRLMDVLRSGWRLPARLLNIWRRRGLSVALLGPDGAGKSTLAAGLCRSFFGPTCTIYMGFGVSGGATRQSLLARLPLPGLGMPGRLFVLWGRLLRAWYHQLRGRLVIFDRYSYDGLAPPPQRRSRLRRLSTWIKSHACPPPGLVLLLDVPGQVMYQRKGDLDPDTLEYQRQRFLALRQYIPRLQVLDAAATEEAMRREAMEHLWQLYAARWGGN